MPGATAGTYFNDPTKFYSDNANGCKSAANPDVTAIKLDLPEHREFFGHVAAAAQQLLRKLAPGMVLLAITRAL
jgi:hypothetical protein